MSDEQLERIAAALWAAGCREDHDVRLGYANSMATALSLNAQERQEPAAWQWRAIILGRPTSWLQIDWTVKEFRRAHAEEIEQGIYELRPLFALNTTQDKDALTTGEGK